MKTRALLADCIANRGLCPGASTVDAWLRVDWVRVPLRWSGIGGHHRVNLPILPLYGQRRAIVAHDVHHALLGYSTRLKGELELAAWELASGGCRWNLFFWVDRITAVLLGLALWPRAVLRAWRAGWGRRNLYGLRALELLEAEVDELRERMRLSAGERPGGLFGNP